jgi:hypothetical protein
MNVERNIANGAGGQGWTETAEELSHREGKWRGETVRVIQTGSALLAWEYTTTFLLMVTLSTPLLLVSKQDF